MKNVIVPISLRKMANSIAKSYGDKGSIVITMGSDRIRIGTEGLTFDEVREVLCTAIYHSYRFEEERS